jgi:hypothetical protein
MPFNPDTETEYRKGGKIMKKTPKKPAKAPKVAKYARGGGVELKGKTKGRMV